MRAKGTMVVLGIVLLCISYSNHLFCEELPSLAHENRRFRLGITEGMLSVMHQSGSQPCFRARHLSHGPVSVNAFYGGISAGFFPTQDELPFSSMFVRLTYSDFTSDFRTLVNNAAVERIDPLTGQTREWRYSEVSETSIRLALFSVEVAANHEFSESNFSVGAGFTFDFPVRYDKVFTFGYEGNVRDEVLYSNDPAYVDGNFDIIDGGRKIRFVPEFEQKYIKNILLGLKASVNYTVSLGYIDLIPSINLNYLLSAVTEVDAWRIHRIQFGLDALYAF